MAAAGQRRTQGRPLVTALHRLARRAEDLLPGIDLRMTLGKGNLHDCAIFGDKDVLPALAPLAEEAYLVNREAEWPVPAGDFHLEPVVLLQRLPHELEAQP